MRHPVALSILIFVAVHATGAQVQTGTAADPNLWLEDQRGAKAMAWVNAENAKTAAVLEKDSHFAALYRDALAVAQASDRIPNAGFIGGQLFNFWQDSAHVRGIWRRTTLASYRAASPAVDDRARPRLARARRESELGVERLGLRRARRAAVPDRRSPTAARMR